MKAITIAASLGFGLLAVSALAQPSSTSDAWRYKLQKVDGGFLRLDAQTGQVSFCRERAANWSCETAADERAALEAEIKRLSDRVAALEKTSENPADRFRVPSDQELDRVMTLFEKMMKRFRGAVENLKRDWDREKRTAS